jgi:hypothetical protein
MQGRAGRRGAAGPAQRWRGRAAARDRGGAAVQARGLSERRGEGGRGACGGAARTGGRRGRRGIETRN